LKTKFFLRGGFNIGTAGFGFITAYPYASDQVTMYFSSSAYAGNSISDDTGTTGVTGGSTNSPYGPELFGNGPLLIQQKLVSFGIRVRYIGTELNRGGMMRALEHPDHGSLDGFTFFDLAKYDSCRRYEGGSRDWSPITSSPVAPAEFDYSPTPVTVDRNYLGIVVQGEPGNPYEFEVTLNFEIAGAPARGATPSFTNIQAVSRASRAASDLTLPWAKRIANSVGEAARFARGVLDTGRLIADAVAPRMPSRMLIEEVD
jgi:hypothetical protein